jgi:hypothetical protein
MKQRGFVGDKNSQFPQEVAGRKAAFGVSMVTPLDLTLQRGSRNCARFLMLNGAFPAARLGLNGYVVCFVVFHDTFVEPIELICCAEY